MPHPSNDDPHRESPAHPKPWERGFTLDEGVVWMIAEQAGLNGRALALAGKAARPVLRLMRAAAQAKSAAKREALVARAQDTLGKLNPARLDSAAVEVIDI